jgi:pyrrolidone-carboxylate peptidase
MKTSLFFLLFSLNLSAKPIILISYFDAFGEAPFNNSQRVGKLLMDQLRNHADFEVKLCSLPTVFDKSFYALEDCLKGLAESPKLVLGLGESNCRLKLETISRNSDKTSGPDNEGNERNSSFILSHGPKNIGMNYPLPEMYCSLTAQERQEVEVSNNAGSFVCNNLSYQFSHHYQDIPFGLIHVPSHHCRNLNNKTILSVDKLKKMIIRAMNSKDVKRLETQRKELQALRGQSRGNPCLHEFYNRSRGIDEKGLWTFLRPR